jgi:hypothetical protein
MIVYSTIIPQTLMKLYNIIVFSLLSSLPTGGLPDPEVGQVLLVSILYR